MSVHLVTTSPDILCPVCNLKLAESRGGRVVMRHRGRVALDPREIHCDRDGCDGVWRSDGGPR